VRARAVVAAMVVLGGCASGDGGRFPPATTTSSTVTTAAPATSTTASRAMSTTATGAVMLRVTGFTLPERGAGLQLTVRAASDRLTLRRRGGGGAVSVCPAGGAVIGGCVDRGAGATIEVRAAGGVELRAPGAQATVEEVTVTYVPAARTTTIMTPARPAGACASVACEATFSLTPGGAGAFALDGQASGGRPRLVLTAVGPNSNRTLATVEGGAALSIRATLEAGSEARLLHHELTDGPVSPVTAEISWP
jgi:hypothetical protein